MRWLWSEWLTPTSKLTILAIIASLNAIWGYPLVGLLAALVTLMSICALTNWLLRPRLFAVMRLPEITSANSTVEVFIGIENRASTPIFDLTLSLTDLPRGWVVLSEPRTIAQVNPRDTFSVSYSLQVADRGEFVWPIVRCESTFPFALFCSRQDIAMAPTNPSHASKPKYAASEESTAFTPHSGRTWVTPAMIDSDVPALVQTMLTQGQHSQGARIGESLEYIGSREYCYGNFVKRWDFASWARLGRPIVRQFDQGSTSNVTIVVEVSLGPHTSSSALPDFETRLSVAATIIHSLRYTQCQIGLIMISPHDIESVLVDHSMQEALLRPLASAQAVSSPRHANPSIAQESSWSKTLAMAPTDHTLICLMAPTTNDPISQMDTAYESERREFIAHVIDLPSSLVLFPIELAV